jgi:hypothetical protein
VDAATHHRLSLDVHAALGLAAPAIFVLFVAITKLALLCARGPSTDSLSDYGAAEVAAALPSERLARLKLRGLRQPSDAGLGSLAATARRCDGAKERRARLDVDGQRIEGGGVFVPEENETTDQYGRRQRQRHLSISKKETFCG